MRKQIHPTELLLTIDTYQGHKYVNESDVLKPAPQTLAEAIKGLPDSIIQVILFDTSDLTSEDVTEECAALWLADYSGEPDDDDQPVYVAESEAFQTWCEQYRYDNGFGRRERPYNTMNHVQQGIGARA